MTHPYKSQADASQQVKRKAFQDGGGIEPYGYQRKWSGEDRLWRPGGPIDRDLKGALKDIAGQLQGKDQSEANWHKDNPNREGIREPGPGMERESPGEEQDEATKNYDMDTDILNDPEANEPVEMGVKRGGRVKK